ncbi:MAG: hypothetical protein OXU41_03435 [Gammaproteobacteria bacterium]|nr:hypothetical protein [Gammaproteobacteria bacterium]MDD9870569.1 hypothetical protein [Gammaproteobacteria bacterium]
MNRTGATRKITEKYSQQPYMRSLPPGGERKMVSFDPELLYQLNLIAKMSGWTLSEVVHEVAKHGMQTIAHDKTNPLHLPAATAEGFVRKEEEEDIALCQKRMNGPNIPWKKLKKFIRG